MHGRQSVHGQQCLPVGGSGTLFKPCVVGCFAAACLLFFFFVIVPATCRLFIFTITCNASHILP